MKRFLLIVFILTAPPLFTQSYPALTGPVVDTASLLTAGEIKGLGEKLLAFETDSGSQIAVCIVPTTGGLPVEEYSIKLAEQWKLGRAKVDDGVLILVALKDRKMRIETGYGLEGKITDLAAGRIIENSMKPNFKNGRFYNGLSESIDALTMLINGKTYSSGYVPETLPAVTDIPVSVKKTEETVKTNYTAGLILGIGTLIFLILGFMSRYLFSMIAGSMTFFLYRFIGLGDSLGDAAMLQIFGMLIYGFVLAVIAGIKSPSTGTSSGRSSSYSSTRSSSASSSSRSSSSYSGGGGRFGGGGASGSW